MTYKGYGHGVVGGFLSGVAVACVVATRDVGSNVRSEYWTAGIVCIALALILQGVMNWKARPRTGDQFSS